MTDPYAGRRRQPDAAYGRESGSAPLGYGYVPSQYGQPSPSQPYDTGQPPYPPQQQYPGAQYYGQRSWDGQPPARRKKRRVFLWVFLAIQALFLIWVIAGAASKNPSTSAQIAQQCYHHAWFPLFKSQADCVTHFGGALNTAGDAGKAIGVGLIIVFWMVVDVILGVSYGVYRLATRSR